LLESKAEQKKDEPGGGKIGTLQKVALGRRQGRKDQKLPNHQLHLRTHRGGGGPFGEGGKARGRKAQLWKLRFLRQKQKKKKTGPLAKKTDQTGGCYLKRAAAKKGGGQL